MAPTQDADSAKVSRNVAIWVALITAAGGFATALVTGSFGLIKKSEPVVQRWIRINVVQLGTDAKLPPIDRVHLIAQVNGVSYAFPTSVSSLWAAVGPGMVSEKYPLPIGAETYRVKFYVFGSTPDGKFPRYEHESKGPGSNLTKRLKVKLRINFHKKMRSLPFFGRFGGWFGSCLRFNRATY